VYFEYICWKFAGRLLDRVHTPLWLRPRGVIHQREHGIVGSGPTNYHRSTAYIGPTTPYSIHPSINSDRSRSANGASHSWMLQRFFSLLVSQEYLTPISSVLFAHRHILCIHNFLQIVDLWIIAKVGSLHATSVLMSVLAVLRQIRVTSIKTMHRL